MPTEEDCDHRCDGCEEEGCAGRIVKLSPHPDTEIKRTIAVMSGKGGVGKSLVTSLLAVALAKSEKAVGILDADITGPSIPRAFGKDGTPAYGDENGIFPVLSDKGMRLLSANNLLADPSTPIIWRGGLISNLVSQMYTQCVYGPLDVLLIDMPPGTGDVPLTVFQSIPLDGIVVVSTPQELVGEVVLKSVKMAEKMNVPLLGFVLNMSYVTCPHCGEKLRPFGGNDAVTVKESLGIEVLDELPIDPSLAALVDEGKIEDSNPRLLAGSVKKILSL